MDGGAFFLLPDEFAKTANLWQSAPMESMHDHNNEIQELMVLAADAFRESRIDREQFAEIRRWLTTMQHDNGRLSTHISPRQQDEIRDRSQA